MLGGWSGGTGCLNSLPGSSPLSLPPLHSSPAMPVLLLDCPPDSLSSPSSCLCRAPCLCIIPALPPPPSGLMLLPSFPHLSSQMFPPLPSSPPVGVCQASSSPICPWLCWFLPGMWIPSSLSLMAGRGVTSVCFGYSSGIPLRSAGRTGCLAGGGRSLAVWVSL